ncbi:MAG: HD domain-containing protein [Eubacterium sp.]|nr:HD domain-containing protein [Candidatus Colimonas fimequi]
MQLQERILEDRANHWVNPFATTNEDVVRRKPDHDGSNLWRPAFVRDCEKIIHLPYYNRYTDKTQVFSSRHNDDISRRALHVQLVSRIARNIGSVLGLNCDLIEAIALGHDLGHTPFGHAGESFLSDILQDRVGLYFNHNIQSGRVLDTLFMRNASLQTLDGIICHNGEFELKEYVPQRGKKFDDYDESVNLCMRDGAPAIKSLVPMTLEGCVVRISDMIAYLGKDRQDACKSGLIDENFRFSNEKIGTENAAIINNITVDIIENSYGKDCILLSDEVFRDLETAKRENYKYIYHSSSVGENYEIIGQMFEIMYDQLLKDLKDGNKASMIYKHHMDFVDEARRYYYNEGDKAYEDEMPELIVADYIASMTDSYFVALFERMFPESNKKLRYTSYFEGC